MQVSESDRRGSPRACEIESANATGSESLSEWQRGGTLAPEVNNFAHQRNLLQNVYYYCSYQEELEFLKSDWS